jgi:hypothetical protein
MRCLGTTSTSRGNSASPEVCLSLECKPNHGLRRNLRLARAWPRPNNIDRRTPDATKPSTKIADNEMAIETT